MLLAVVWCSSLAVALATPFSHPKIDHGLERRGSEKKTTVGATSRQDNLTITASATLSKSPFWEWDLPGGATTSTSCQWNDTKCASLCHTPWWSCSSSWSSWKHYDVVLTEVPFKTTLTTTFTSSSFSFMTSPYTTWVTKQAWTSMYTGLSFTTLWSRAATTYIQGVNSYVYALDSGVPVTTMVVYDTQSMNHESVVSSRKDPPTCSYTACAIAPKPNPATCKPCEVQGGTVELIYWADMATSSLSTSRNVTGTAPVTALYKNTTLTSPTVYIEFQTAYATNACNQTVGGTYPGALIGVNPESLYSVQAKLDFFEQSLDASQTSTFYNSATFDFHHLSGLVPGPVYEDQPSCFAYGCHTVFLDYHPVLVLPSQVRNMDPAWESCGLDWHGAWDPPKALQPAEVLNAVTTPAAAHTTTSAAPQATVAGGASQTSSSQLATSSDQASDPSVPQSTSRGISGSASDADPTARSSSTSSGEVKLPESEVWSVLEITTTLQVASTMLAGHGVLTADKDTANARLEATETALWTSMSGETRSSHPETALVIGGQTVSQASNGLLIGGTHLTAGGYPMTIHSMVFSAASDNLLVVESWSSVAISTTDASQNKSIKLSTETSTPAAYTQAVLPLGTTTVTVASGTVAGMWIVNGKTLRLGDPGLTIAGHTLVPGANALYKDGVSASFQTVVGTKPWTTSTSYAPLPVLTTELAPLQGSGMVYVTTSADLGEAAPASTAIRSLASGCSGCATVTALLGFVVSVVIALILWW